MKNNWYKYATAYQIYPKSFKDTTGSGQGDLRGIIEKLPYLKDLGVEILWLNPVYLSPMVDNGYDISDYRDIDPSFGTMADFKTLLDEVHALDMKLIMDLVVNHTSDQHPWFLESKKSKDNPYRDYYLWQDATPDTMPNNWRSFTGESAWTYDDKTKQAYFHVFAKEQPDLNWGNPRVREEIYDMVRFWLDMGIDGFRLDAISHLQKADWDFEVTSWEGDDAWVPFMNVAGIERYLADLKAIFDEYGIVTVGEASGVSSRDASRWTDENGYITMIFEWEQNVRDDHNQGDVAGFIKVLSRWQTDLQAGGGWQGLYLENHDIIRVISSFADGSLSAAKAFAVAYFLLRGTPFIYQGQELGLKNTDFKHLAEVDSPDIALQYEKNLQSGDSKRQALEKASAWTRDHARRPMPWSDEKNGGFTTGTPWLMPYEDYQDRNARKAQKDKNSVYYLYQRLITLRKTSPIIAEGTYRTVDVKCPYVFAYERTYGGKRLLVIANLSDKSHEIDLTQFDIADFEALDLGQKKRGLSSQLALSGYEFQVYLKFI